MPEPGASRLSSSTLTLRGWCPPPCCSRASCWAAGPLRPGALLLPREASELDPGGQLGWGCGRRGPCRPRPCRVGSWLLAWVGWTLPPPPTQGSFQFGLDNPPRPCSFCVLGPLRRHAFRGLSGGQHPVATQTVSVSESQRLTRITTTRPQREVGRCWGARWPGRDPAGRPHVSLPAFGSLRVAGNARCFVGPVIAVEFI